jgi:hypothetical protein
MTSVGVARSIHQTYIRDLAAHAREFCFEHSAI